MTALAPTTHLIYLADARSLAEVGDASVDLAVTSPPYWCLKDYGHAEQTGYAQSYPDYLAALVATFRECHRVLRPGCRLAINIGDQYLRASEHDRYRVQPIPADLTTALVAEGLDFMGSIIWRKISTTHTTGGGALMGSMYYPRDGHVTYEHEYILLFRKQGKWRRPPAEVRERSRLTKQERLQWFRGVWDDLRPTRQELHQAMFPLELPRRLIRMYSFWGETVLDPFLGSGSTSVAAALEGRHSVGYEINEAWLDAVQERFRAGLPDDGRQRAQVLVRRRGAQAADDRRLC